MKRIPPTTNPLTDFTGMEPPAESSPPWGDDDEQVGIGVWPDMPNSVYRRHTAVAHSDIRHWIKPRKLGRVGVIGSALHTLALEGRARLDELFVTTKEDFDLRGREGRDRAAELIGDSGKELLRNKERMLVERMFDALGHDRTARMIIDASGKNEVSLIGKFEGFEREYKARVDMIRRASIWDLKTSNHIDEQQFRDSEVDFGYINQMEWYATLYATLTATYLPCGFVCVSKREPHNVWIRKVGKAENDIPNQLMAMGKKWREDMLTLYEQYVPKEMREAAKQHGATT